MRHNPTGKVPPHYDEEAGVAHNTLLMPLLFADQLGLDNTFVAMRDNSHFVSLAEILAHSHPYRQ